MTQLEIMTFLDNHPNNYYTVEEIITNTGRGVTSTYRCLRKITRREEYSMKIMPAIKTGRGSNSVTMYAKLNKEEKVR